MSSTTTLAPPTGTSLKAGDIAPELLAKGWVNGRPASDRIGKRAVRVIDVWAPWCLVCHEMAPGMVELHKKYRKRGVEFISLTDMSKSAVDGFVRHFEIPWSSGFGAPKETVSAFRALRLGVQYPDRQIAPVLYVIGSDSRVRWSDDAGRYRHEDVQSLLSELDSQLEKALAVNPQAKSLLHPARRSSS